MTDEEARQAVVEYWLEKASAALASASDELRAGRLSFAVNRVYYACFYALSSVLVSEGLHFIKHSGVRGALHRSLVKVGRLDPKWGRFYDRVFEHRQRGDYQELVEFEEDQVRYMLVDGRDFVAEMRRLLGR